MTAACQAKGSVTPFADGKIKVLACSGRLSWSTLVAQWKGRSKWVGQARRVDESYGPSSSRCGVSRQEGNGILEFERTSYWDAQKARVLMRVCWISGKRALGGSNRDTIILERWKWGKRFDCACRDGSMWKCGFVGVSWYV